VKRTINIFIKIIIFSALGYILVLAGGFFAVRLGLTNVKGAVDSSNNDFQKVADETKELKENGEADDLYKNQLLCEARVITAFAPINGKKITVVYEREKNDYVLSKMNFAASLRLKDKKDFTNSFEICKKETKEQIAGASTVEQSQNLYTWADNEMWPVITESIIKEKDKINKASEEAGIEPRLLVAPLVVEQLRLYHTQREAYEKFFKPLKILGNANQMAMGVMAIKEKAAIAIEDHLKDKNSPYYLGEKYENLLDFKTEDHAKERYERLTTEKDHYYSYLYGALYLKQFISSWEKSDFPIDHRPEILGTLFNLGFERSDPKREPQVGGSELEILGTKYTFGALDFEFYYSGEMADEFLMQ
jgi:hypothetical protein